MILSIETSSKVCSVALHNQGKLLLLNESTEANAHSAALTTLIEEMMQKLSISFSQLNAVAVSEGPGSYTGLRIGVSAAKGFCFALGIPLIMVSTLKALAYNIGLSDIKKTDESLFMPMLDARRMEVYLAVYDVSFNTLQDPCAVIVEEGLLEPWLLNDKTIFLGGDGVEKCKKLFIGMQRVHFVDQQQCSADAIGKLAWEMFQHSEFSDVAYSEPFYLKDFVAAPPKVKGLYE